MTARVIHADCLEALRAMEAESVDAIVCDPPYGLEFMGREWDSFRGEAWRSGAGMTKPGIGERKIAWPSFGGGDSANATCKTCGGRMRGAKRCECEDPEWRVKGKPLEQRNARADSMRAFGSWCEEWAREALRVAKPGAHLVAFGGTRTYHRLACAIEDAGWEVRDCLSWLYGSGFPKSLDVSKAIDKAAGAERSIVIGTRGLARWSEGAAAGVAIKDDGGLRQDFDKVNTLLAPATDAARQWQGWGTALKPAWEPIILARKPLVGIVAANVTAYGTGAINVDACRIGTEGGGWNGLGDTSRMAYSSQGWNPDGVQRESKGRWPANVALDEEAAAMLDEQSGTSTSVGKARFKPRSVYGADAEGYNIAGKEIGYGDSGGASRFFYTAKASRSERNAGCDGIEARPQDPTRDVDAPGGNNPRNRGAAPRVNSHPTVKPVALMRWLVRMVTPPGGVVLDPFCGSGSTLVAAIEEGFDCIGIEREAEYVAIIEARVAAAQQRPQRVAKPKPKRQPVKVQPAATAPPTPIVSASLPGQLALAWGAE